MKRKFVCQGCSQKVSLLIIGLFFLLLSFAVLLFTKPYTGAGLSLLIHNVLLVVSSIVLAYLSLEVFLYVIDFVLIRPLIFRGVITNKRKEENTPLFPPISSMAQNYFITIDNIELECDEEIYEVAQVGKNANIECTGMKRIIKTILIEY